MPRLRRISIALTCVTLGSLTLAAYPASAQNNRKTITDLFNTGVDNSGNMITPGNQSTLDLHYTDSGGGAVYVLQNPVTPPWASSSNSNWISVDGNNGDSVNGGNYARTFLTNFTLPQNANLNTVTISGSLAVDNDLNDILINGHSIGISLPSGDVHANYQSFHTFTLPTGFFVKGSNTLAFDWQNVGGPGGLNVMFSQKSYLTSVPELGTSISFGCMLLGAGLLGRRTRRKHAS